MNNTHIVLGVTGSIAAYKSADIIRRLKEKGFRVSVVMTKCAEQFITPLTLASLSGEDVSKDMFDVKANAWAIKHIEFAQKSNAILIAPATANIIGKIANGLADDLLTCLVMAAKVPVLVAPAMNDQMYNNTIVQDNCKKLKGMGFKFIEPIEGSLACGTHGDGHLAEVDDIVKEVEEAIAS